MITRDLADGRTILIRQEDHADAAGFFAAHWGNSSFSRPSKHGSVIYAATYHDTHYKELEAVLPIDRDAGRPFGHRQLPFASWHLDALQRNISFVSEWDPYAGVLVSMHHTGLPQNRYGMIRSWRDGQQKAGPGRPLRPELSAVIKTLEMQQQSALSELGPSISESRWFDYRLLQVFDLFSLYICCDGFDDVSMHEAFLGPVPQASDSSGDVDLRLIPQDDGTIRVDPYPFDQDELTVSMPARTITRESGRSEDAIRLSVLAAPRGMLTFVFRR